MTFPAVPFDANIDIGAVVYSPTGSIVWGKVSTAYSKVVVETLFADKVRIVSPLWDGKKWSVKQLNVHPITIPSTDIVKTHTIDVMSNGSLVIDNVPYS